MSPRMVSSCSFARRVRLSALVVVLGVTGCCATAYRGGGTQRIPDLGWLDGYLVEGGAWVDGGRLFVNREFDFSLAMADEIAGAGIAAAKRLAENRALARRLRGAVATDLASDVRTVLRDCGRFCAEAARDGVVPWGFLFGKDEVRVQAVFDLDHSAAPTGTRRVVIVDSEVRAIDGSDVAWTASAGSAVLKAMMRGVSLLPDVLKTVSENAVPGEEIVCPVSATFRYSGRSIHQGLGWRAFALAEDPATLVVCVVAQDGLRRLGP